MVAVLRFLPHDVAFFRTQASNRVWLAVKGPPAVSMHTTEYSRGPTPPDPRIVWTMEVLLVMSVSNWVVVVVDFSAWDIKKRPSMWTGGPTCVIVYIPFYTPRFPVPLV